MSNRTQTGILLLFLFRLRERYGQLQVEGRTKMQKIIYLVSRNHTFFNLNFIGYHYGPYSKELQQILAKMSAFGLIREESEFVGFNIRYNYELTQEGITRARHIWETLDEEQRRMIDNAAEEGSRYNAQQLNELLIQAYRIAEGEDIM